MMTRPTTTVSASWWPGSGRAVFGHMKERFEDFREQYEAELDNNPAVATLQELAAKHGRVTLLYGARDSEANHARVLLDFLQR